MVNPWPPPPPRSVAKALETEATQDKLAVILAVLSQTVRKDETDRTPEECSGQVIQSFLVQISSGVEPVPGLERVTVVGLDPDGRVLLMHSIFSVRFNVYLTQRRLFACLGELPSEGLPPVVEIPDKAFVSRRTVLAVPRVDHVTHLGGVSLLDWQKKPCKRAVKSAGTEYVDLACRGLTFAPPDCAS